MSDSPINNRWKEGEHIWAPVSQELLGGSRFPELSPTEPLEEGLLCASYFAVGMRANWVCVCVCSSLHTSNRSHRCLLQQASSPLEENCPSISKGSQVQGLPEIPKSSDVQVPSSRMMEYLHTAYRYPPECVSCRLCCRTQWWGECLSVFTTDAGFSSELKEKKLFILTWKAETGMEREKREGKAGISLMHWFTPHMPALARAWPS